MFSKAAQRANERFGKSVYLTENARCFRCKETAPCHIRGTVKNSPNAVFRIGTHIMFEAVDHLMPEDRNENSHCALYMGYEFTFPK